MSENRVTDAQAGAESFGGALLAALAGVNSVSGPGMLDYTIAFSLPKLLLDNELCGQALQVVRPFEVLDDLPAMDLAREQLAEGNLLTAAHTLAHYRDALYTPGPIWDRQSEDSWVKGGRTTLVQRAAAEVERRLAAYQPVATDPAIDRELRRLLLAGIDQQDAVLPVVPPPPASGPARMHGHQRRNR
jgi:trimethylamine--corrinoid protein Co-methyltransferase